MKICGDLAEADAAIAGRNVFVDKDAFGEKVSGHDAIVGAAAGPDDGLFLLCGNGVKTGGEVVLYRGGETTFVFVEIFDQVSEERSGLEYGAFDDRSEIERFCRMGFEKHGWTTIIGPFVAEIEEGRRRIKHAPTTGCEWGLKFFIELFFKQREFKGGEATTEERLYFFR